MVALRMPITHEAMQAVVESVEATGGRVGPWIPDHAMLVVGSQRTASAARALPGVSWVGPYLTEYKVAPEWKRVLDALNAPGAMVNGSAMSDRLAELGIGCSHRPLRIGIQAQMPFFGAPLPHAPNSPFSKPHQQRMQRLLKEAEVFDSGAAAAADWGTKLTQRFGKTCTVRRGSPHMAIVEVEPQHLQGALDILAAQPSVHWIAPLPRIRLHNHQAASIIQSAQAASPISAGDRNTDPSLHPLWAAGITGTNQTIGLGDSGIGERRLL